MAIGWMSALKVIPWGDVIEAAPGLVKGARKMFSRSEEVEADVAMPPPDDAGAYVAKLEARLHEMAEQQKQSARLIDTLAQQNARVVEAVEILRVRSRLLIVACAVLGVGLVGTLATLWWMGPWRG